jgi:hypothetical protein
LCRELEERQPIDMEWVHMNIVREYRNPKSWWKLGKQGLWRMVRHRISRGAGSRGVSGN